MADTGFIVQGLRLKISGTAGLRDASPYMVGDHVPMRFDFDVPSAYMTHPRRDKPTIFASEQEARTKVDELVARVKALLRIQARGGKIPSVGQATMLIPRDFGSGEIGGYEIVPASGWFAERDEEQRYTADVAQERVAQADSEVRAAQERADALRGELEPVAAPSTAGAGKWVAAGHKVQRYERGDGTQSFRGRDDGKVSPSFPTLEEAIHWVEGDREPQKVSDDRTAALDALGDVMMRS